MKKYILINDENPETYTAITKVTNDIREIAKNLKFETVIIKKTIPATGLWQKCKRKLISYTNWRKVYKKIERDSVILLSWPFRENPQFRTYTYFKLKKRKKVKFIVLVLDIFELCGSNDSGFFKMCAIPDVLIVHNEVMKQYLVEHGIPGEKLVCIEIFDYLRKDYKEVFLPKFEKSITVAAGNLASEDACFVYELHKLKDVKVNIYGKNYDAGLTKGDNVFYGGSVPSNELQSRLTQGFGLVWYGTGIEENKTGNGSAPEYIKYNDPYRLSLYLASGLPVIIWNQAATAEFVKKYDLGIMVSSLLELPDILKNITEEEYYKMEKNVSEIAKKLSVGYFTDKAITKAIEIIKQ